MAEAAKGRGAARQPEGTVRGGEGAHMQTGKGERGREGRVRDCVGWIRDPQARRGEECSGECSWHRKGCACGRFLPATVCLLDVLQTAQAESEQGGAAILSRGKACELGGRICLSACEGANKQTGEMTLPLWFRGGSRDGE